MINVYATKEDYSKHGSKMLEDEEIEKYLELASIDINRATLTRIEKRGFDNLTSQQKDLIIKATCIQAEYIKEEGIYDDNSISSYSIGGDLTVNEKESQDIEDKLNISKLAFFYLKRTGLTNRII
nr:MAG TPA: Head Tail Connector Protein [Caudoviricetes sp.]